MKDIQEKVFWEIHSDNPREGPGSSESTRTAYMLCRNLPDKSEILDIGCGPGQQSLDLTDLNNGHIYAVDYYPSMLKQLKRRIREKSKENRFSLILADMNHLPFCNNHFDLIWAEGSIYNMGFENGLTSWYHYLRQNGYLAITEISWLKKNPPDSLHQFWNENYPSMKHFNQNIKSIKQCGYKLIDSFELPASDWWDVYYKAVSDKIDMLRKKYSSEPDALNILEFEGQEINFYKNYYQWYGYVFYIAQKI
ncbi:MAG: methyltransferase domain-containing protein [Calditrichaeota bacterium]|nr:methyltransferase domain-containing protein [Calditrichota bacterium]